MEPGMMPYLRTFAIVTACVAISLTGCGGGDSGSGPPPAIAITTQILSDSGFDGDIQQTAPSTFTVTQGMSPSVQSVFAGIDPATLTEFRAFLDFPLSGAGGVPGNAIIESAFLDIYIDSLQPSTATIPILIELVSFQPPTLLATDFDRTLQPPLAYVRVAPPFAQADVGTNVSIDVTSLMVQAQQLGLTDFQVRIMEDPPNTGLIEINDTTGVDRALRAPELTVTYF
jgi:predicted secreted protein